MRLLVPKARRFRVLAPVMVWLSGCGAPRPIMYYGIQVPATPAPAGHRYPINVAVGRIMGPDLLRTAPIVYKTGRNQIGTYQYHRWSETPVEMVQMKLIRLLRTSGEFQSVSGPESASEGELVVRGRLYDLTEVDGEGINGLVT